jgi:hypothetical protein
VERAVAPGTLTGGLGVLLGLLKVPLLQRQLGQGIVAICLHQPVAAALSDLQGLLGQSLPGATHLHLLLGLRMAGAGQFQQNVRL